MTMTNIAVRLVLRRRVLVADLAQMADENDWTGPSYVEGDAASPDSVLWTDPNGTSVQYTEDQFRGLAYLVVLGPTQERIARSLGDRLPILAEHELLAGWDESTNADERKAALNALGVGAPPTPDDRFERRILEGMRDRDAVVRASALFAALYTEWPAFADEIARGAEIEPDEYLRTLWEHAATLLT